MKRQLRAGKIDPVMLLEGRDASWSALALEVKVGGLLNAIPRLGGRTVRAVMAECGLFPDDRLKESDEGQRKRLVQLIRMLLERE